MMDRAIRALGRIWDAIPVHPIRAKLEVTASVRNRLSTARRVSVAPAPILARSAKVFAMGSCFAVEIRKALAKAGYDVYPKYRNIKFDPDSQQPGNLPQRDDVTQRYLYHSTRDRASIGTNSSGQPEEPAHINVLRAIVNQSQNALSWHSWRH